MMQPEAATIPLHRLAILAAVSLCGAMNAITALWAIFKHPALNTDFIGIWSFARFIRTEPLSGIYVSPVLQAFQQHIFPGFHSEYVFPYPPSFLLVISWLGHFNFATAYALWTIAGVAALALSAWALLPPRNRWFGIIAILAAPASLLNGIGGETGYFTAALLLLGLAILPKRPILAGMAFGLLALKPQLALLVPFALLARSDWRALFSAAVTVLAMAGLSTLVFPPSLWLAWLHSLSTYQSSELTTPIALTQLMATVTSTLLNMGVPPRAAAAAQCLVSLPSIIAIFIVFKKAPYRLAAAALIAGGFLVTPHAYAYDTIPLTAALLLLAEATPLTWPLVLVGLAVYLAPLMILTPIRPWFFYALPEALLFTSIIRLAFATDIKDSVVHEPEPRLTAN